MPDYSFARKQPYTGLLILGFISLFCSTGYTHEYWLDPVQYHLEVNNKLAVNIRNGQNFKGTALIYDPGKFARHYTINNSRKQTFESRIGDYPALKQKAEQAGLSLVLLDTTEKSLVYPTLEKFHAFLDYHALTSIKEQHSQRDMPTENIKEDYYRFNKSFVEVSESSPIADADSLAPQQQILEIVAHENPYVAGDELDVQIFHNGEALAGRQVEIFRQVPDIQRTVTISDDNGFAKINIASAGKYMINVVHVVDSTRKQSHWKSYWASMTFLIKEK